MDKPYIIPVVGQIYRNRNGGEYCLWAIMQPIWSVSRTAGVWPPTARIQYGDGSIKWNYSTGEHFPY